MLWACAVTFWHQQEDVIEQLIAKNLQYFFPRIRRTIRQRGKRYTRLDPLLFNYIPVCLKGTDDESLVLNMRGVTDLIGPACEVEIGRLKAQCDADGVMIAPRAARFKPGQAVSPKSNSLLVGEFRDERRGREVALFNILGAKRPVEFEIGDLVAA